MILTYLPKAQSAPGSKLVSILHHAQEFKFHKIPFPRL